MIRVRIKSADFTFDIKDMVLELPFTLKDLAEMGEREFKKRLTEHLAITPIVADARPYVYIYDYEPEETPT